MSNVIYLRDLGCVADDATDNTVAGNAAIALANATGNVSIVVPSGINRFGLLDAITANDVHFVTECGIGRSIMKGMNSAGMLRWGNATKPISGGGCDRIGFMGNSVTTQALNILENANEVDFNGCVLGAGVATFMRLGTVSTGCYTIGVNNLTGKVPNIAAPLFSLVNGAGLFLVGCKFYNQAFAGGGSAVTGRHVFECYGRWNTLCCRTSFLFLFDNTLLADIQTGKALGDVAFDGCFLDEMNNTFTLVAQAGGAIGNVSLSGLEMTGKKGSGIYIGGSGSFLNLNFDRLTIRECKREGIVIESPITLGKISNCVVSQVNEPCDFTGSIAGTTLTVTARTGTPGGTIQVGDPVTGTGVAVGTVVTALLTGKGLTGTYTISNSQTVTSRSMTTGTGKFASLYMAAGSTDIIITGNSFGTASSRLGPGNGAKGVHILGGTRFQVADNSAQGLTKNWDISGLVDSNVRPFSASGLYQV